MLQLIFFWRGILQFGIKCLPLVSLAFLLLLCHNGCSVLKINLYLHGICVILSCINTDLVAALRNGEVQMSRAEGVYLLVMCSCLCHPCCPSKHVIFAGVDVAVSCCDFCCYIVVFLPAGVDLTEEEAEKPR